MLSHGDASAGPSIKLPGDPGHVEEGGGVDVFEKFVTRGHQKSLKKQTFFPLQWIQL